MEIFIYANDNNRKLFLLLAIFIDISNNSVKLRKLLNSTVRFLMKQWFWNESDTNPYQQTVDRLGSKSLRTSF